MNSTTEITAVNELETFLVSYADCGVEKSICIHAASAADAVDAFQVKMPGSTYTGVKRASSSERPKKFIQVSLEIELETSLHSLEVVGRIKTKVNKLKDELANLGKDVIIKQVHRDVIEAGFTSRVEVDHWEEASQGQGPQYSTAVFDLRRQSGLISVELTRPGYGFKEWQVEGIHDGLAGAFEVSSSPLDGQHVPVVHIGSVNEQIISAFLLPDGVLVRTESDVTVPRHVVLQGGGIGVLYPAS